jgi:very-short-patch-repair endonuclease
MNKKLNEADIIHINTLLKEGKSRAHIGKIYNVDPTTITNTLKRLSCYTESEYHRTFRQLVGYEDSIEKLYLEGKSVVKVHNILELKCSSNLVKRYLKSKNLLRKAKRCYGNTHETIRSIREKLEENSSFIYSIYVVQGDGAHITRSLLPFECGYDALRLFLKRKGWWRNRSESQSRVLQKYGNQFKITKPEQSFIDWCKTKDICYTYQYTIPGHTHNYDFYIPSLHTIVEIDGDWFHAKGRYYERPNAKNIHSRDWFLTEIAETSGYKIFRFTESELKNKGENIFESLLQK